MKKVAQLSSYVVLCCVVSLMAAFQVVAAAPLQQSDLNPQTPSPTGFTYQGQLKDANGPVNGSFDFQFVLYPTQAGGERLSEREVRDVVLTNGVFNFKLDFGHATVEAKESWLEIGVRPSGSAEAYTVLFPRQKLTPTPYAIFAQHEQWSLIGVPVGFVDRAVIQEGTNAGIDKEDQSLKPEATAAAAPQGTANFIAKFDSRGIASVDSIMFNNGANVGIGTTNPSARLHISSNDNDALRITSTAANKTVRMGVDNLGVWIEPEENNSSVRLNANPSLVGLYVRGTDGNVGIGTTNPFRLLTIGSSFDAAFTIEPTSGTPNAGYIRFGDQTGWKLHFGRSRERSAGPLNTGTTGVLVTIQDNGNVGLGTTTPQAKLDVVGMTRTGVLQITGGGDLAEPFEISEADSIQPGLVVAIDPDRPGHLRMADRAYDRTVAGIISGANGINPGLTMKQAGSVADGAHPVSLTGRVYCWADASYGPIAPGDLLTTSDTPGHAMKVTNHARAQGAIIGKAMTALAEGRGLVLVLVTLQ